SPDSPCPRGRAPVLVGSGGGGGPRRLGLPALARAYSDQRGRPARLTHGSETAPEKVLGVSLSASCPGRRWAGCATRTLNAAAQQLVSRARWTDAGPAVVSSGYAIERPALAAGCRR